MKSSGVKRPTHRCRKGIALLMASALIAGSVISGSSSKVQAAPGAALKDKYVGFEGIKIDWKYGSADEANTYEVYSAEHGNTRNAASAIDVPLTGIRSSAGSLKTQQYEGRTAVFSEKSSEYIEFTVNVPEDGMYQMEFDYYLVPGASDAGKRILYVDGETPFSEASDITFERFFKDAGEPVVNSVGDETRPAQEEIPGWRTRGLQDTSGIYPEAFSLCLTKGNHTIQLIYNKVDMYISGIRLMPPKEYKTYAEVKAEYNASGYKYVGVLTDNARAESSHIQAELTTKEKNNITLRRDNDGDPLVEPASDTSRKLNVMGGYRWRTGNQSITWEFYAPETGLYKIGMYVKQSWNDGLPSYRQIAIDGEVPFEELLEYAFDYNTSWSLETLSAENGDPYLFYLTEGSHTMTMTVKMGELGPILSSIQKDIEIISEALLNINLLAGSNPDPNYDYGFFEKIPNLKESLEYIVQSMGEKYKAVSGLAAKRPAMANNFLSIQSQVQAMLDDPYKIAKKIGDLTSSQTSLSEWYLSLQSLPLVIDWFVIGSPEEEWKSVSSNIFQRLGATAKQFFVSFTKDYDNVGGTLSDDVVVTDTINVWIARGTEWAEVIKELADESFTPDKGIAINVNVLPASQLNAGNVNALMLSITSGKAPDVALGVDVTSPVEFAIREQVYDLSKMEGFEEVKSRFVGATLTPYEYMGGTYAIPETMNFNVMFYRKDLLTKYDIDLPNVRTDLYEYVLPALYQNGLEFYFGRDFTQFLFQNGGSYYTEDGLKSALDTPEAYQAFKEYTELFTNYGVPETANFYQYMRSGIMPLGVGDFNMYMQLSVAAPEIAGRWGIAPLPGVKQADGTINRAAGAIAAQGDVIMKQSDKPKQSWEFLKWWSSSETQERFAKEVEALMGAEARWNTANKDAFLSLAWNDEDLATLEEMWKWSQETPTVLGSYMTTRHMTNAWTTVVISGGDVREALEQAVKDINREMRSKQEEYGVIADER